MNQKQPLLYEVNTRCWLREFSERSAKPVTLGDVPDSCFAEWQRLGFTHIWLMGVWSSGSRSRQQALANEDLQRAYAQALPDWREEDVGGSPYAIADYTVPAELGGEAGLNRFREKLHRAGLKLILDFVPNHLGLDHRWVIERPDVFVQAPDERPGLTFQQQTNAGVRHLAHGKDPYFPAWTDTVQLDYRRDETRTAMMTLLGSVAARCDGARCDMAMLLLNDIFTRTWGALPELKEDQASPNVEFWSEAISQVKQAHPGFVFLAEAYWGTEPRLQALGFDFTYDKALYDHLTARDAGTAQRHLLGMEPPVLVRNAHFLENHDEPRIASVFHSEELLEPTSAAKAAAASVKRALAEHRAAALLILALPGMRFLHDGQLSGARIKTPVQLVRRRREPESAAIRSLYEQLLATLPRTAIGQGRADLLPPDAAWVGNPTAQNFVVIQWQSSPREFFLVVINFAPHRSQCRVFPAVIELASDTWAMDDILGDDRYSRSGTEMKESGLFLDLAPYGAQLFRFLPAS